jgi:hypothetical protein
MPWLEHANRRADELFGLRKMADPSQLIDDDGLFQAELPRIVGVLPAATAAAVAVVPAGRLDATGGSALDRNDLAAREVAPLVHQLDPRQLAGQGVGDENDPTVRQMAQRFAAERGVRQLDVDFDRGLAQLARCVASRST